MKILAVEAAANVCSVALAEDDLLLGEQTVNNKKTHSQVLMPMLENLLELCGVTMSAVDCLAVSDGPGSFTGLRIGISTVKGLAYTEKKQVYAISTLEAMAYKLPRCAHTIVPIMDARRGQVYCAAYIWEAGKLNTVLAPAAESLEDLCKALQPAGNTYLFTGDGVLVHREQIRKILGARCSFAPLGAALQSAAAVAAAAFAHKNAGEAPVDAMSLQPKYLRKSQAEREYDEKEQAGGKQDDSNRK